MGRRGIKNTGKVSCAYLRMRQGGGIFELNKIIKESVI